MNHRILRDDTKLGRVSLYDFKLDGAHATADQERIALSYWAVGLEEIWLEINLEQIAGKSLHRIIER